MQACFQQPVAISARLQIEIDSLHFVRELACERGLANLARADQGDSRLAGQPFADFRKRPSKDHAIACLEMVAVPATLGECASGRSDCTRPVNALNSVHSCRPVP